MSDPIVIVSAARTPMGSFQGDFASLAAHDLGGAAIAAAVARAGIAPDAVTEVLFGNCLMAGQGQAPARQAAFKGGLPKSAGAVTLSKMCGSGMRAAMFAHDILSAGSQDVMVAGGMESMTNAPYLMLKGRGGYRMGHDKIYDHMMLDGLEDAYEAGRSMGTFGEDCAAKFQFTREAQDHFAMTSVQRAKDEVARGRRSEREFDRLEIAHFTHHHDVRILAQRTAQRRGKGLCMHADLAVIDQRLLRAMHKLDRVLDGDDVIFAVQVRVIDHRGERGAFARTRRTGHEYEAFFQHRETLQDRRKTEFVGRQNLARNEPEDRGDAALLVEKIRAIAGAAGIFVAEIDVAGFLEDFDLLLGGDLVNQRLEIVVFQRGHIHAHEFAIDAKHWRVSGGKVQIGGALLLHELEE